MSWFSEGSLADVVLQLDGSDAAASAAAGSVHRGRASEPGVLN